MTIFYNLNDAIKTAQEMANRNNETFHIIDINPYYEIVNKLFKLNRNYYHDLNGEKKYFTFIQTVKPTN